MHQFRELGRSVTSANSRARRAAGMREHEPTREGAVMANTTESNVPGDDVLEEPVPAMQQLLDNPFLLLFIGIAVPTVLYTIWGVMEIVNLPIAK
jgi:hypothetical protein